MDMEAETPTQSRSRRPVERAGEARRREEVAAGGVILARLNQTAGPPPSRAF